MDKKPETKDPEYQGDFGGKAEKPEKDKAVKPEKDKAVKPQEDK